MLRYESERDRATREAFRARTLKLCRARGIRITPFGRGFELIGSGVSLVVADLAIVTPADLEPPGRSLRGYSSPGT